jgi:hypothetical protein
MDDQRTNRAGGEGVTPSKWLIVIPIILTCIAFNRPAPIILLAAAVAWVFWAALIFRPVSASARSKSQRLGCGLSVVGAVIAAISFMVGFGKSMSPGSDTEIFLIPMIFGGVLMLFGLLALITPQK